MPWVSNQALNPSASSCRHKIGDTEGKYQKLPLGNCYSIYADQLNMDYMANRHQSLCLGIMAAKNTKNNQSPSTPPGKSPSAQREVFSPDGECCYIGDLSYYVK